MIKWSCFIVFILSLLSCGRSDRYKDSPILGDWQWQVPIISDGVDYTEGYWAAHDAICYKFLENGVYIEYGGPEPLEPQKYCYEIVGDSLLHLYESSTFFWDKSYTIVKVSPDTIWLRSNPHDQDHDYPLNMGSEEEESFLVR